MKKRPQSKTIKTPSSLTKTDVKRLAENDALYGQRRQEARLAMGRTLFEQARKDGTSVGRLAKLESGR